VVLVYDVTRQSTFEALSHWIEECTNHNLHPENVPMLIVGNKLDGNNEDAIGVPTNIAQRFADSYNMPLFETSAKSDEKCDHVEAIFLTLAHKINANKLLFKTREELESTSTVQVTSTASVEEESGYCCF
jgi:Ras-related protein Rab-33B